MTLDERMKKVGSWRLTERNKTRTIIVDLLSVAWTTSRVVVNAIFPAGNLKPQAARSGRTS
jgi:hypothetical protein